MAKNGVESKQHEKLRKYFFASPRGKISEPTTIVDNHGKILVWYLPNILSPERVVSPTQNILNFGLINHLDKELHQCCYQGASGFTSPINSGSIGKQETDLAIRQLLRERWRIWGRTTYCISGLFYART